MAESVLGKINYLTEEQYQNAKANGQINENEIYMTPDKTKTQDVRLFYNANGHMGNIQFAMSKSKFEKIQIIYSSNGGDYRCAEIPTTQSMFSLYGIDNNGNGTAAWMKKTTYTLTENGITINNGFWKNINSNESGTDNCIKIIEVIGISSSDYIKVVKPTPEIYSTAETLIGTWVNGKPLYRRLLPVTTIAGQQTYNIADWKVDLPVNMGGYVIKAGDHRPINFAIKFSDSDANVYFVSCFYVTNTIRIQAHSAYAGMSGYVILEYTKTTD